MGVTLGVHRPASPEHLNTTTKKSGSCYTAYNDESDDGGEHDHAAR